MTRSQVFFAIFKAMNIQSKRISSNEILTKYGVFLFEFSETKDLFIKYEKGEALPTPIIALILKALEESAKKELSLNTRIQARKEPKEAKIKKEKVKKEFSEPTNLEFISKYRNNPVLISSEKTVEKPGNFLAEIRYKFGMGFRAYSSLSKVMLDENTGERKTSSATPYLDINGVHIYGGDYERFSLLERDFFHKNYDAIRNFFGTDISDEEMLSFKKKEIDPILHAFSLLNRTNELETNNPIVCRVIRNFISERRNTASMWARKHLLESGGAIKDIGITGVIQEQKRKGENFRITFVVTYEEALNEFMAEMSRARNNTSVIRRTQVDESPKMKMNPSSGVVVSSSFWNNR